MGCGGRLPFTLPAELRALAKARADVVLDQIMRSAWSTVNQFAHNDRQLQGTPGAIAVLHTHSRRPLLPTGLRDRPQCPDQRSPRRYPNELVFSSRPRPGTSNKRFRSWLRTI